MFGGMVVMFVAIVGVEGIVAWLAWRRVAEHLKENPEGVAALTSHLFLPLLGRKAEMSAGEAGPVGLKD